MPLVVTYAFAIDASSDGDPAISSAARSPWWVGLLFLAGAFVIGTALATLIRLPIPATLGPLILTAAIELAGGVHQVQVPIEVMPIAFIVIGWQAGLSFTRSSIAALRRIFVRTLTLMVTVIATCAGLERCYRCGRVSVRCRAIWRPRRAVWQPCSPSPAPAAPT